jgi:ABC-type transport system substrate-binding protein
MLGENPAVKAYPHDVAKAKALLAQAGFAARFRDATLLSDLAAPVHARAAARRRRRSKPTCAPAST